MSNSLDELRDLLDDAVREPATTVRVDAGAAWREGRRRRTRNVMGVAAVTLSAVVGGVLALSPVLSGLPGVVAPASGSGARATEHPARLDYVYWDDEQPTKTGPLAGVVHRSTEDRDDWYSVSPKGDLWRVDAADGFVPALSPDGSHLGYMQGPFLLDATYVIVDQVDGTVTRFRQIGTGGTSDDDHRFWHTDQLPAFWSPDGSALLLRIGLTNPDDPAPEPAAAVLGTDGAFVTVPQPAGGGGANPVGWVDAHHVALAAGTNSDPRNVRVWIIDIRSGQVVREFTLADRAGPAGTDQWFGSVSSDGNQLGTAALKGRGLGVYSMRGATAGDLVSRLPRVPAPAEACVPSWSSSEAYVPTVEFPDGDASILAGANGGATIVADPRLGIDCSTWSRTALDGRAHASLGARIFGQQDNWLSWHWREITGSVLLAIALWLGSRLLARRRRSAVDSVGSR